jgi:hypothetical protein
MLSKYDNAARIPTFEKACAILDKLTAVEDDWTYEIEECGPAFVIATYDETGQHIGYL